MATNGDGYIQPCMILDDDELTTVPVKHTSARSDWRNAVVHGVHVVAAPQPVELKEVGVRVFGGRHDTPSASASPNPSPPLTAMRGFPTAFQTYRPTSKPGPTSPFQQTKHKTKESTEPPGTLIDSVRNTFYNSNKMAEVLALPTLKIGGGDGEENEEEYYTYGQCTPPAVEPPPPGFVPRTPEYSSD